MAVLSVKNPTLMDLAKITDPDGKISAVVEILNETNEVLDDMTWVEGNLPTGHRTTIRSGIPAPTWRKMYGGVQPTKSTTVQVTDNVGNLEAYAEIDKDLAISFVYVLPPTGISLQNTISPFSIITKFVTLAPTFIKATVFPGLCP